MVAGLIIDAFGELRDQQEQVKEDMEVRRERTKARGSNIHSNQLLLSPD